jgi:hypothetical protein
MRRRIRIALSFCLTLPLAAGALRAQTGPVPDEPLPSFPPVTAENLLGESFDLPGDLPGDLRIVFVAFRQRQQSAINTWLAVADALEADYEGLRYFEFPTISRPFRLMKPVIDNGMRSGIPSDSARARTITLFTSVSRFVEATGLPGTDDIATLLLDSEGYIRWHSTGVHTAEREQALRRAIEALQAGV